MRLILGICGKIGTGKNMVADYIHQQYSPSFSVHRIGFTDPLKRLCQDLFDHPAENLFGVSTNRHGDVRDSLQILGEACRKIDPNVWVTRLLNRVNTLTHENSDLYCDMHPNKIILVTDVRFSNEASAIVRKLKGKIIKIERRVTETPITKRQRCHVTEKAVSAIPTKYISRTFSNDRTREELFHEIDQYLATLISKNK